jgi:hypothetical protein
MALVPFVALATSQLPHTVPQRALASDRVAVVEVVERRPGTACVVPFAVELFAKNGQPIRLEKSGPASSFVTQLREEGVEVEEVSTSDHARATGQFINAASSGGLAHLGGQSLRSAVVAASLRSSGDGDLWARRSSKMGAKSTEFWSMSVSISTAMRVRRDSV